jgi:hypothetical protein
MAQFWTIPEALILVELGVRIGGAPSGESARAVDILFSLRFENPPTSFVTDLPFQVGQRRGEWYDLFNLGLDAFKPDLIARVGERTLREAVRSLSPFETTGLGTYDFWDSL